MKKFEYKEIEGEISLEMLNEQGLLGWEFIKTEYKKRVLEEYTTMSRMETYHVQLFKKENG